MIDPTALTTFGAICAGSITVTCFLQARAWKRRYLRAEADRAREVSRSLQLSEMLARADQAKADLTRAHTAAVTRCDGVRQMLSQAQDDLAAEIGRRQDAERDLATIRSKRSAAAKKARAAQLANATDPDATKRTLEAIAHTPLRPREQVVADVRGQGRRHGEAA